MENQGVDTDIITAKDCDAVLQFLPYFADPTNKFFTLDERPLIDPFLYSEQVEDFIDTLRESNFLQARQFEWTSWSDFNKYWENPDLISDADLGTLIKLLTNHVRTNRFVTGHLAGAINNGHMPKILQRLSEIRKERFP